MANQVVVTNSGNVQVSIEPPPNVQVQISRAAIGNITVSNVSTANTANYAANVTGNSQPNITSVGTLTGLTSSGNITAPFFLGNVVGNISGNIVVPGSNTSVLYNANGNAGSSNAFQFNYATNVATINGNLNATNISGNGAGLSSITGANVTGQVNNAAVANSVAVGNVVGIGNIATINLNGNANNLLNGTGNWIPVPNTAVSNFANYAGNVVTAAQPNITSLGTLTGLSINGNITGNILPSANVTYNLGSPTQRFKDIYLSNNSIFLGAQTISADANGVIFTGAISGNGSALSSLAGANVTGTVANATHASTSNTVTNAAQSNITSLGNLTGLTVSGNATVAGNLTVGGNISYVNVQNLYVTDPVIELGGGANGQPLTTNDGKDRGTLLHYYTTQPVDAFMGWDNGNGEFGFGSNVTNSNDVITFNQYGNVRASNFIGNLTGNISGNANFANSANVANTANSVAVGNVVGIGNIATVNLDGNASNILYGNGSFATPPVISNVANANYANFAGTAYSVSGSNVTGEVANANYASFANIANTANSVAGANVTGTVANANYAAFSGVAYSVSGSNVSGEVANANYSNFSNVANSANSVAVGNVVGIGNIATVNLDGNAGNILYGNGTFATAPVVSNVANANYANFAGTAYSVSGSNVSGEVANANYASYANIANSANSVAVGNVVGIGNIATVNLDGNGSNVLLGNGVFGNAPSSTPTTIANGTSNINIAAANGNIAVSVNNNSNLVVFESNVLMNASPLSTQTNALRINSIGNPQSDAHRIAWFRSRGTVASPLSVQPNDAVFSILSVAHNGTTYNTSYITRIQGLVDSTYTANTANVPMGLRFQVAQTTQSGPSNTTITHNFWSNGNVTFAQTVNAGNFAGDGTSLSNITGANVTGTVANANYATSAGIATSANSVAVANVTGIGNIATINLNGNGSQVLAGNGAWIAQTGGNTANANYANFAGTANIANLVYVDNANANSSATFYPVFVSSTGNGALQLDNFGNTITYIPDSGALTTNIVRVLRVGNDGSGENIDFDGTNNSIRMSVTGDSNALVISNTSVNVNALTVSGTTNSNRVIANGGGVSTLALAPLVVTPVWNNASANMRALQIEVQDTASLSTSFLMEANVNGASRFNVTKAGDINFAGVINGNGSGLTNIPAANITGTVSTANTVTNNSQPNITTASNLTSIGNVVDLRASNSFIMGGNSSFLQVLGGTVTTDNPSIRTDQTYNNASVDFRTLYVTITDTASNANSKIADFRVNSTSRFSVGKTGNIDFAGVITGNGSGLSNLPVANISGLGNIATINLNGNGSQVLAGNGAFVAQTGGGGTPGGSNTQIQFNNNGSFGGVPNVTYNGTNISLGNISTVKISGGVNNEVIRTDGTGNLSFTSIALNLLVGTRAGPSTVPITNYTFPVQTRSSGNVTVYVN